MSDLYETTFWGGQSAGLNCSAVAPLAGWPDAVAPLKAEGGPTAR